MKDTRTIRCSNNISLCYNLPLNLGLCCLIVVVFLVLLQSIEKFISASNHTICPLSILILSLFAGFVLCRRLSPNWIKLLLFTGIIVILVMVDFLTHNSSEAREPERIVIAGGDSFEPMIFLNSDGKPDGMYVDLWLLWSEKTGVEVELRLMDWDKTIPALLAGEVDAVDGVSFTPERAKFLDFSDSYAEIPSYIFFHESIGGVRGLADLEGFPVGVIGGSHVEDLLRNEAPKLRPIMYVNYEEIVQTAIQGRLRVFIGEDPMIPFLFAKMGHRITFRRTEKPIISSDMRTAVRKGDTKLLALIERGHKIITPAERQRIRDKWAGVSLKSRIPWRWLIGGVVVFFTGIAFLLTWNTQLQKRVVAATRTIKESEERLRSFTKALPDLAFLLDDNGKYLEVLTAEEQLLYMDFSDVKNSYIHEILPSDVAELSLEIIQKTIATGKTQVFEYKLDFPTGVRWFEARLSPILGTSSDKRMVTCIARDITDRKQAEEALRESEERYRMLFNSANDAIFVHQPSADGKPRKFIEVNDVACKRYGYTREELLEFTPIDLVISGLEEDARVGVRRLLSERHSVFEIIHKTKDGKEIPVEISAHLFDFQGRPTILSIVRDITDRKRSEEERLSFEARLQQSQKIEAIGTLAGGIAHDFNNILGIILGNAELALDDVPDWNPAKYSLEEIKTASLRAKDVVRQLLSFSRKTDKELKSIKIIPIIKESLRLIRASIPTTINIHQNIPKDCNTIIADPTQLHQIMINLSTNAAHAMQEHGGILEVSVDDVELGENDIIFDPSLSAGKYVRLMVRDTGIGIASEFKDQIFDPYFTTKEVGKGTGMGLAVVHGIIKSCNGGILIESEPGRGSTFTLYFPAVLEEPIEERESPKKLPGGNERILLVDDEESIINIGERILHRLGYQVETEKNPVDALAIFHADPGRFDLVILDMTMPQMTGDKLAEEILAIRPGMPIILCSGYSEKIDEEIAEKAGIRAYVMKPIEMNEIANAVRQVLDEKRTI